QSARVALRRGGQNGDHQRRAMVASAERVWIQVPIYPVDLVRARSFAESSQQRQTQVIAPLVEEHSGLRAGKEPIDRLPGTEGEPFRGRLIAFGPCRRRRGGQDAAVPPVGLGHASLIPPAGRTNQTGDVAAAQDRRPLLRRAGTT